MTSFPKLRPALYTGVSLCLLFLAVSCGISGGPSLIRSSQTLSRIVEQPVFVPCDPAGSPFGGGDGLSATTAFAICTATQLAQMGTQGTAYYILASDIDLSSSGYSPQSFSGTLDGNRHVISNLTLSGIGQQAFFLSISGGSEVKDLGFDSVNIQSQIGASYDGGGTLAYTNSGTISGCYAKGIISGTGGTNQLGGLVTFNDGTIENSYTMMTFSDLTGSAGMGGIAAVQNSGTTQNSYSASIFHLASGSVVGGISASGTGNSDLSFWDSVLSGTSITAGTGTAVGKTTSEMKGSATFTAAGWSSSVWYFSNTSYPKFVWEP